MPKLVQIADSLKTALIPAVIGGFARGDALPLILFSVCCDLVLLVAPNCTRNHGHQGGTIVPPGISQGDEPWRAWDCST